MRDHRQDNEKSAYVVFEAEATQLFFSFFFFFARKGHFLCLGSFAQGFPFPFSFLRLFFFLASSFVRCAWSTKAKSVLFALDEWIHMMRQTAAVEQTWQKRLVVKLKKRGREAAADAVAEVVDDGQKELALESDC